MTTRRATLDTWLWPGAIVSMLLLAAALALGGTSGAARTDATPQASPGATCGSTASPVGKTSAATPQPRHGVSIAREVTIRLTDRGFDPNYVESTNGHDVTIHLVNDGGRAHSFRSERLGIDECLRPRETATVVIERPPLGDFDVVSDAPGDEEFRATLTFYI